MTRVASTHVDRHLVRGSQAGEAYGRELTGRRAPVAESFGVTVRGVDAAGPVDREAVGLGQAGGDEGGDLAGRLAQPQAGGERDQRRGGPRPPMGRPDPVPGGACGGLGGDHSRPVPLQARRHPGQQLDDFFRRRGAIDRFLGVQALDQLRQR